MMGEKGRRGGGAMVDERGRGMLLLDERRRGRGGDDGG